jgi:hypothetical protein
MFTRQEAQRIADHVRKLFEGCDRIDGVHLDVGRRVTFGEQVTLTITAARIVDGGVVVSKERSDYTAYARAFGLPLDLLGQKVLLGGKQLMVVGLKTRARKMPVLLEDVHGKRFKAPVESVLDAPRA